MKGLTSVLGLLAVLSISSVTVLAEEQTCAVKGMHCAGCTEMVEGNICDDKLYSKCEAKVTDEKKQLGYVHVVTKEATAKVDQKALAEKIKDSGYTMEKCSANKPKKS